MLKYILLLTSFAFADIAIEPFGTSYHWDRDKNRNENNKYLGVVYRYGQYDFGVATFENSHYERSNTAYIGYRQPINEHVGIFGAVGYVTGYNYKILGAVGVYVEYENIYIKASFNHKYMGTTIGYVFKGF